MLESTLGAHDRGAILVAAVFRAFLLIYRARTADLFRIATQGTGTLPEGEIHPDLTARLAQEAARCADRVLQMCIRAIDYCPPVDITFGGFLRGVITADLDFSPEDRESRIVFIESFREWGIYPIGISSMGVDALAWPTGEELIKELVADRLARRTRPTSCAASSTSSCNKPRASGISRATASPCGRTSTDFARASTTGCSRETASVATTRASSGSRSIRREAPPTVSRKQYGPAVEVHAVRPAIRRTARGMSTTDLVIEITQRRDGYFDKDEQERMDDVPATGRGKRTPAGLLLPRRRTILVDPATSEVRRVIRTPGTIADTDELDRVRDFLLGEGGLPATPSTAWPPSLRSRELRRPRGAVRAPSSAGGSALMPPVERLRPPENGATVRMYRQGHGDCFLIAFPREGGGEPYYVMIDCGYKPGSQAFLDHGKSIGDVVKHLHASCGGHLDLAILTHEHQDHLNGIWKSSKPYFETFEIEETWVAWTEDPKNDLANDLRKRHQDQLLGLLAARRELALAVGEDDVAVTRLDSLLGLELGAGAEKLDTAAMLAAAEDPEKSVNKQAMKLIKEKGAARKGCFFRYPGLEPLPLDGAAGIRAFILGPPESADLIADEDPHEGEGFPAGQPASRSQVPPGGLQVSVSATHPSGATSSCLSSPRSREDAERDAVLRREVRRGTPPRRRTSTASKCPPTRRGGASTTNGSTPPRRLRSS